MKNRNIHWLLEELPDLVNRGLLTPESAARIREHYDAEATGPRRNWAVVVFGILGAALIGSGIILLLAHNWEQLTRPVRTVFAFAPLVFAQLLAGYVLLRHRGSAAWREAAGVFWALSIGASIALVAQTYHISGDFASFMLTWALAGLPIIYLLNASAPAMLYVVGITTWAGNLTWQHESSLWFWPLAALVVPHLWCAARQNRYQARVGWLVWTLAACGAFGIGFGLTNHWRDFWMPVYTSYFAALYLIGSCWFDEGRSFWQRPFQTIGALGVLVLAIMLTFGEFWHHLWRYTTWQELATASAVDWLRLAVLAVWPVTALALWTWSWKRREPITLLIGALPVLCLLGTGLVALQAGVVVLVLMNLYTFGLGVAFIGLGVRDRRLGVVNLGLLVLSALIIARFFDSDLGFVLRGLAFIAVGSGFLITNYILIRKTRGAV